MSSRSPSVLLVEDDDLLRLGLKISLEKLGCWQILGQVSDGESAVSEALRLRPEIVLMDVGLPGIDGIEATWRIKQGAPRTRVVMFTSHNEKKDVIAALGAGADGYCSKDTPVERVSQAMSTVLRGEVWLDASVAEVVESSSEAQDAMGIEPLTEAELNILALIKRGLDNDSIADQLHTNTEKVARVMHNIIQRFVEKTVTLDVTRQSAIECSGEWLTIFLSDLDSGQVFADKYLIEALLGSGGVGAVFKAKHLYMDRYVALKLLHPELTENRLAMRNFQREAVAIGNVQHRNIAAVYDFGVSRKGEPFLVMEYVEGTDLAELLKTEHRLHEDRLVRLCMQVCDGLTEAHGKGIVHCDLKPSNILMVKDNSEETVKLVDFGLAQILPREGRSDQKATDKLLVYGTPLYMSPEQCEGKILDVRSDIYSLGCIMYEALTGKNVFRGESAVETFHRHCQLVPPAMAEVCLEMRFSYNLESCVHRMLAKRPGDRPQTMAEVKSLIRLD